MTTLPRLRLTRTLVYEGTASWIDTILALNTLGPSRPVWPQPGGTITETESRLEEIPSEPKPETASPAPETRRHVRGETHKPKPRPGSARAEHAERLARINRKRRAHSARVPRSIAQPGQRGGSRAGKRR